MPKITKRVVEAVSSSVDRQSFTWNSELRGFGVRMLPSGSGSYIVQYRNGEGRSRRMVLGSITVLTPHALRHTFASMAGELGYSELTICALLGHASRGVTQRYVHIDKATKLAADEVSSAIVEWL
jgi:integrase